MGVPINVLVFINEAAETSIPLEIAGKINDHDDFAVTICSFFEPEGNTFGYDVCSLDATSQFDIQAYRRLYSMLKEKNPDIIHIHPNATGSVARVVARIAGVPHLLTTEHSLHTEFGFVKNIINGGTNWLNEVLVCNSEATSESFPNWEDILLRVSNTEKAVIYNGVDFERLNSSGEPNASLPKGFLIGTVGRLAPEKNQASIINAVSSLVEKNPEIYTIIVGGGDLQGELKRVAADNGVADNVRFLGTVSREEVYSVLNSLDIFVLTSRYEGFGVAVVEAMATGTAVVVNDIPVMREVADDAAVFVDATDPDELVSALEELYNDDQKRQSLEERGEEMVRERFPLERTLQQYQGLYKELVLG